jgi:hypothetical protein
MRQVVLALLVASVLGWVGCGDSGGAANISFIPSSMSLTPGEQQQLTANITDSKGNLLTTQSASFTTDNAAIADVSVNGLICAGTWTSPGSTTPGPCTPTNCLNTTTPCDTTITGTVPNTHLSAKLRVLVHQKVETVTVTRTDDLNNGCVPLNGTATFAAAAFNGGNDITSTVWAPATAAAPAVSPFVWKVNPASGATLDSSGATCSAGTTCVIKAVAAGSIKVNALFENAPGSNSSQNVVSTDFTFNTCP